MIESDPSDKIDFDAPATFRKWPSLKGQRRYRARTCDWVKVKNRQHPAFARVMDQF